ncbi:MAG: TonB-dependent receptor plug domain-containing protein, partial [Calditrichaeota bacterium]|nr:TonB-dependent receptor plug domain-containing protein [Calditrichota bacterium]
MRHAYRFPLIRKGFLLSFWFLLPLYLGAQQITLTGQILSCVTHSPVPYANVLVEETGEGTFASGAGRFRLNVGSLPVTLRITRVGFADTVITTAERNLAVYLVPTVLSGEEVLVTATRAVEGRTPVAFTTLDREELDRVYSHQDVPMVLAGEPGVYAYSDAGNGVGYTYLKIRGFSQERIGFYLNGIPLNDPEAHAVYWVDHGDILAATSDVQLQRGVGNSLYGSGVFGGTVNLATDFRALPAGFTFNAGYGNYTEEGLDLPSRKLSLSYAGGPWQEQGWTLYGRFSDLASDGYRIGSGTTQRSVHAGLEKSTATALTRFEAIWGHEETAFSWEGIIPLYGYDLNDREDRRYNYYADTTWNGGFDNANKDVFTQSIVSLQHSRKLANGLLSLTFYNVKGDGYYEQFKGGRDVGEYNLALPDTVEEVDLLRRKWLRNGYSGVVYQYAHTFEFGKVTVGGDARFYASKHYGKVMEVLSGNLDVIVQNPYYTDRSRKTTYSFYVHSILDVTDRLSAMVDLRYLGHRYTFDQDVMGAFTEGYRFKLKYDFVDPHLGLNYRVSEAVSFFANLSTGHREPADGDLYDHDDPDMVPAVDDMDAEYATPLVREEFLIDYEAGVRFSLPAVSAKLNIYRMDLRDELVPLDYRYYDTDNVFHGNAPETVHQGFELSLEASPLSWLWLQSSVTYADNHVIELQMASLGYKGKGGVTDYNGMVIPAFPKFQAKGSLGMSLHRGDIWAEFTHVGKQFIALDNIDSLAINPYSLVNFGTRLQLPEFGPVRSVLTLRINNLFDALYETFGYTYYDDSYGWPPYRVDAYWPGATRS